MPSPCAPLFVTFEGPEGSGKSTQVTLLRVALEKDGHEAVAVREPGDTAVGEAVRELLLNADVDLRPRTETLLFNAARAQLVDTVIRPALAAGRIVLCDRYADSTLAYQGFGLNQDPQALEPLIRYATDGLMPDLRIYLDLDPARGLQRHAQAAASSSQRIRDRFHAQDLAFHRAVHDGYRTLMQRQPAGWLVVDAQPPPAVIQRQIHASVLQALAAGQGNAS